MAMSMTIIIPDCEHEWLATSIRDICDRAGVVIEASCRHPGCYQTITIEMAYGLFVRPNHARENEATVSR